jgi:hypothetical protein
MKPAARVALAVATHPTVVKSCALFAFRLARRLGREAGQTPDRVRRLSQEITEAWVESGQDSTR